MKSFLSIIGAMLLGILLGCMVFIFLVPTENEYKEYIIKHQDEINVIDSANGWNEYWVFDIDTCNIYLSYFTDVTIHTYGDSAYSMVFWGDRNSWLWYFKSDKKIDCSIPYNRYKGKNVDLDIEVIKAIFKKVK